MTSERFEMPGTLAVIGGGRMGEAIVAGFLSAGVLPAERIVVAEPLERRRAELSERFGVRCLASAAECVEGVDTVLLAVKPQLIDEVVTSLAPALSASALVVSIAAGISCPRLESMLPAATPVVRVMPNAAAMVGEAMSVVSGGSEASERQVESVRSLFAAIGTAVVLDERHQDAATAISGSGPAYVAIFVDALARAGVSHGLTRDVAQQLAIATVRGTARMLEETGLHPEALVDAVASPGGTTIAAVSALERRGFRSAVGDAVDAAAARSKELGS